jgi:hypothetical protein
MNRHERRRQAAENKMRKIDGTVPAFQAVLSRPSDDPIPIVRTLPQPTYYCHECGRDLADPPTECLSCRGYVVVRSLA